MTDKQDLSELFTEIQTTLSRIRTLVTALDDLDAALLVNEMEFGLLAPMRRLRVHLNVPYTYPPSK